MVTLRTLQWSCGLSARNSASIFNHQIEYLPCLRPSRKRDFQSHPLDAPRARQVSFGLSMGNSASIFNRRIEYYYSPCLRPSQKRDFESLPLDVLHAPQGSCTLSRRTLTATFNRQTEYFHRLRRIAKRTFKVTPRYAVCSLRIIRIVQGNLGHYFQNLSATCLATSVTQSFSFTCLSPLHARVV